MTKVDIKELCAEIANPDQESKKAWAKELYKDKVIDLAICTWQVTYNDGTVVKGPKGYADLKRENVKSIAVVDPSGNILHSVDVVDDFFAIRYRNLARGLQGIAEPRTEPGTPQRFKFSMSDPKRTFILVTKDNISYVWDDGDIDEIEEFGDQEPYRPIKFRDDEK